jgi:hypothetical protein
VYRWPIRLLGDGAEAEVLWLEVPPRGAAFTLPCLMHLGHPVHLALVDAYVQGSVPFPPGASLGRDSRAVLANLVGPLALLYTVGCDRATLADLLLLPPSREAGGHSRLVVRTSAGTAIRLACASARSRRTSDVLRAARRGPTWHHVVAIVPTREELGARTRGMVSPRPITVVSQAAEDRGGGEPTEPAGPWDSGHAAPSHARRTASRSGDPREAAREVIHLTRDLGQSGHPSLGFVWEGLPVTVSLTAEAAGGHTVALLPDRQDDPERAVSRMEGAAWATLEALIGMPIEERQSEPIALRLVGPGRAAELTIGRSLVLPRNRRVFAAWLGSDGRVVIRLTAGHVASG